MVKHFDRLAFRSSSFFDSLRLVLIRIFIYCFCGLNITENLGFPEKICTNFLPHCQVVTVAGTAVTGADMAATAAASGEGMAPAEPEARRGGVHEEARAVEREEQAPVGEGREPSPIKHRSAIELCKTKEQSLQKQKLNLQSQYTKNTNLLNFLLTS